MAIQEEATEESISLSRAAPVALAIASSIIEHQAWLSEIDGATGDGDHGINMAKGFRIARERMEQQGGDLAHNFTTIGDTLLGDIGGSMGPLYGSFFIEMADALKDSTDLDCHRFGEMLHAGERAITDLGEAKPGDKTLIDVLSPASEAYDKAVASGVSFARCLEALGEASKAGLESTRTMVARLGRASRLGERSRGSLDAGACSCDLILQALAAGITERLQPTASE